MPIDFLEGKVKKPVIKKEAAPAAEMHVPAKEKAVIATKEVKPVAPKPPAKPVVAEENNEEVNLVTSFRSHLFKKRLTFIGLFVIIIVLIGGFYYYYFTRMPTQPVLKVNEPIIQNLNLEQSNVNLVVNENLNIQNLNTNENVILEPVVPPAVNEAPIVVEPVVLPDTELAPLRGALVRFADETNVYLVENNGELRLLEKTTVVFKNGQSVSEIKQSSIYLIANRWQGVRKGKDVKDQVDFDPRVLIATELESFE